MIKKFNIKFYMVGIATMLISILTGCNDGSTHNNQGYKQKVIYDLGDGYLKDEARNNPSKMNFYYLPGSYITDFSQTQADEYVFVKNPTEGVKYELEGWYLDEDLTQKVNFMEYKLPQQVGEAITLYAKWEEIFDKFFQIYYINDDGSTLSEKIDVNWELNKEFKFNDNVYQPSSEEYTLIGSYIDQAMTIPLTSSYVLTKDSENLPIYTKWIAGKYKIINSVKDFEDYYSRFSISHNLYLNADLDLGNSKISSLKVINSLKNKTILGNNHTISNWNYSTLKDQGTSKSDVELGAFANKIENCTIKNLNFVNMAYTMDVALCKYLYFAPLANEIINSTIENVNVSGIVSYSETTQDRLTSGDLLDVRLNLDKLANKIDDKTTITNCIVNVVKKNN